VGYRQRERKRRKSAAVVGAQRESRRTGSSARKWWLTVVGETTTCCARCGGVLRSGREMVYRHTPREALCVSCAERDPLVKWRPSRRWEERRAAPVRRA
jgi:hypothetical protein